MDRVIIRLPEKHNHDKINEFRRLYRKHRALKNQINNISWGNMMEIRVPRCSKSEKEWVEVKAVFKEIRLQSHDISDRLVFLLERFYGENVLVNAEYKIITALDPNNDKEVET